ncbi:MAG TPA: hypothetical protein VMN83_03670, partial [Albitalea sp.]|nr:hypothetical protein [Albitalea sp.]
MKTSSNPRRTFVVRLVSLAALASAAVTVVLPHDAAASDAARTPQHHRSANAVVHWNTIAGEAFAPSQGTNPMAQSRTLAILHASIHDALNAIDRRYESYTPGLAAAPKASVDAAVAASAREVLVKLLPEQATRVEAAYGEALAAVRDGPAKTAGIAAGQAAAWATMN